MLCCCLWGWNVSVSLFHFFRGRSETSEPRHWSEVPVFQTFLNRGRVLIGSASGQRQTGPVPELKQWNTWTETFQPMRCKTDSSHRVQSMCSDTCNVPSISFLSCQLWCAFEVWEHAPACSQTQKRNRERQRERQRQTHTQTQTHRACLQTFFFFFLQFDAGPGHL